MRHLSLLLTLPAVEKELSEELCKLVDHAKQHVKSLSNLGVEITSEISVKLIEMRLPQRILAKWDETLTRESNPKFDDIIEFVYKIASHISMRTIYLPSSSESTSQKWKCNSFNTNTSKRFKTFHKESSFVTNAKFKCAGCSESDFHYLYRCDKFLNLKPSDRLKIVRNAGLCENCLRSKHALNDCNFGNCIKCNKRHNTLLHVNGSENRLTTDALESGDL